MQQNKKLQPLNRLNFTITLAILACATFLLWYASHAGMAQILVAAFIFSHLMLINYALLHEGSHDNHNSDPALNRLLSTFNGALFPVSFTFYQLTHGFHHENNRSEHECFEYYNPDDPLIRKLFRHLQWYSILIGTYWFFIPVFSLIAAILPWLLKLWPINAIMTTNRMFDRFDRHAQKKIGIETGFIIAFWVTLWLVLDLKLLPTLILYASFAVNWSTRQYIAHAFSPVDKETGALNLKLGPLMEKFLLNANWHLLHHQQPDIPWHLLPEYAQQPPDISYWRQYLRLWTGPRPLPCETFTRSKTVSH